MSEANNPSPNSAGWKPSKKWTVGSVNLVVPALLFSLKKYGIEMSSEEVLAFIALGNIGLSGIAYFITDSAAYIAYRYDKLHKSEPA